MVDARWDEMEMIDNRKSELFKKIEELRRIKEEIDKAFNEELFELEAEYSELQYKSGEFFMQMYNEARQKGELCQRNTTSRQD